MGCPMNTVCSSVLFYGTVGELLDLLSGTCDVELDRAALDLARIEYPGLVIEPFLEVLDSHARELSERVSPSASGLEYVIAANEYLFTELGFTGNSNDYYNAANSCLNEVLTTRVGIPITLSLVYMEIGRRLGRPVYGIGLPGHFLVKYDDGAYSTFVDAFHGGNLLSAADCCQVAREVAGIDLTQSPEVLAPITKRQMLVRMINNLKYIYFPQKAYNKLLQVLNLLLAADPTSAEDYKQRGMIHLSLQRFKAAKDDLERYVALSPGAADREEIAKHVELLKQWLAGLN